MPFDPEKNRREWEADLAERESTMARKTREVWARFLGRPVATAEQIANQRAQWRTV